jgi:hypothetical protein
MEPLSKIVVRYLDGRVVKGYTQHFDPDGSHIHLRRASTATADEVRAELRMEDLKAIFFVRTFDGNPRCRARREFIDGDKSYRDKVEVTFGDGEVVRGYRMDPYPRRSGFFLLPPDPEGNNVMIFVISTGVEHLLFCPAAPTSVHDA